MTQIRCKIISSTDRRTGLLRTKGLINLRSTIYLPHFPTISWTKGQVVVRGKNTKTFRRGTGRSEKIPIQGSPKHRHRRQTDVPSRLTFPFVGDIGGLPPRKNMKSEEKEQNIYPEKNTNTSWYPRRVLTLWLFTPSSLFNSLFVVVVTSTRH